MYTYSTKSDSKSFSMAGMISSLWNERKGLMQPSKFGEGVNGFTQETVVVIKTLGTSNYYPSLGNDGESGNLHKTGRQLNKKKGVSYNLENWLTCGFFTLKYV